MATIVDMEEYRKKHPNAASGDEAGELKAGEIELLIPMSDNENHTAMLNRGRSTASVSYKADLREDIVKLDKVIMKTLRYMELRMTLKVAMMCIISICISTGIIAMFL